MPQCQNFKAEDLELLAECVETHKGELFGKFSNTVTTQSKSQIWDRIETKQQQRRLAGATGPCPKTLLTDQHLLLTNLFFVTKRSELRLAGLHICHI